MASNRIGRINEEVQRELAALIPTVKDPRVTGMISVTAAESSTGYCSSPIYRIAIICANFTPSRCLLYTIANSNLKKNSICIFFVVLFHIGFCQFTFANTGV